VSVIIPEAENAKAPENSEKEKVNSSVPGASNPKKMMSAARQLSKGSLGLGGENSMASTVFSAMGKKNSTAAAASTNEKQQEPAQPALATANTSTASAAGPSKVGPPPPSLAPGPANRKESNGEQPSAPSSLSRKRHDSQASETSSVSATSSATSAVRKHPDLPKDKPDNDNNQETEGEDASLAEVGPEGEDTMKNLRKTFAGIFGEMN